MSIVVQWVRGCAMVVQCDCAHWFETANLEIDLGDEIFCSLCADLDIAQEKGRLEGLKEALGAVKQ